MRGLSLLWMLFLPAMASGQIINGPDSDTTEWRGWTGVQLHWRPSRTLTLAVQEQWRWREDFTRFDRRFHQVELEWKPKGRDWVDAQSLAVGLRHSSRPDRRGDIQGVDKLLRWQIEHGTKVDAGRWTFKTRARIQQQTALALKGDADPETYGQRRTWRFKGTVEYNIKGWKWDPAFAVERFIDRVPEGWQPDGAWRMRLATGRKVAKRTRIKVFFQRDWVGRYNPAEPGTSLAEIGAGIDDLRLQGAVEWTAGLLLRHRFKSPERKKR